MGPGQGTLNMGVVVETNHTSRTTFREAQSAAPVKVPLLSWLPPLRVSAALQLIKRRPLDHVLPLD